MLLRSMICHIQPKGVHPLNPSTPLRHGYSGLRARALGEQCCLAESAREEPFVHVLDGLGSAGSTQVDRHEAPLGVCGRGIALHLRQGTCSILQQHQQRPKQLFMSRWSGGASRDAQDPKTRNTRDEFGSSEIAAAWTSPLSAETPRCS